MSEFMKKSDSNLMSFTELDGNPVVASMRFNKIREALNPEQLTDFDIEFLDDLEGLIKLSKREWKQENNTRFNFNGTHKDCLIKLVEQSTLLIGDEESYYCLNGDNVTAFEFNVKIGEILGYNLQTEFEVDRHYEYRKFIDYQKILISGKRLSSLKVVEIEKVYKNYLFAKSVFKELFDQEIVFLKPPLRENGNPLNYTYLTHLLKIGLKGRKIEKTVYNPNKGVNSALIDLVRRPIGNYGQDTLLAFKELYTGDNICESEGLLSKIKVDRRSNTIYDKRRKNENYIRTFKILARHLEGIDPDKHFVYGLQGYFPKGLKLFV